VGEKRIAAKFSRVVQELRKNSRVRLEARLYDGRIAALDVDRVSPSVAHARERLSRRRWVCDAYKRHGWPEALLHEYLSPRMKRRKPVAQQLPLAIRVLTFAHARYTTLN